MSDYHTAIVVPRFSDAERLKKRLFGPTALYEKQRNLFIGAVETRWEGLRFKVIMVTQRAETYAIMSLHTSQYHEFYQALQRRLDRDGVLIRESEL